MGHKKPEHKLVKRDFIPYVGYFEYAKRNPDSSIEKENLLTQYARCSKRVALWGYHFCILNPIFLGTGLVSVIHHLVDKEVI
ncbi:MAG: hypothetical protein ABH811_02530 [archaeon]